MLDTLTLLLFNKFPREIGPRRKVVSNLNEFIFYFNSSFMKDFYVSLYPLKLEIDKIFIEIDAPSVGKALNSALKLHDRLNKYDIPHIIVFSGHRGFHFYILFKRWIPVNVETARAVIRDLQLSLTEGIEYIDTHCFGNVRQLVRVPGTRHPKTKHFCTYIPQDFDIDDPLGIVMWSKSHHVPIYHIDKLPDIKELVDVNYVPEYSIIKGERVDLAIDLNIRVKMLKDIIRPCLYKRLLIDREPPHEIRTDLVAELYWLGFTEEQVFNIIRELNWTDFNPKLTKYHIHKIFEKKLLPMSCSRLSKFVKCTKCGWNYFWLDMMSPNRSSKNYSSEDEGGSPPLLLRSPSQCDGS